ncbi:hypothetical protein K7432_015885 [Basidiobolus ranarum]|uniref:Uncharacterized protein n=1 Tax=Basidiobolus ranarum TaxID=34480 RepID=A0ABR2WFI4_9FUNG
MSTRIIESFTRGNIGVFIDGDSPQMEAIQVKKERKGVIVKYEDPKRGWLDIEFIVGLDGIYKYGNNSAEGIQSPSNLVKYLAQVYIRIFNELYATFLEYEITEANLLWACDHRPYKDNGYYKYSWHATTNIEKDNRIFMFANVLEEAQFFKTLMAKLVQLADDGEIQASILLRQKQPDPSVYSKNRAFCLLHSSKYPGETTSLKQDATMNAIHTGTDLDYFPIYHSSFERICVVLPSIKGKHKEGGILVGSSPKVGNSSSASSNGDIHLSPVGNRTKRQWAINNGDRPCFDLSQVLEKTNTAQGNHFSICSLPSIERFAGAPGILRSFFRRCPREYDVV